MAGSLAGYHSARLYKLFNGKDWKKNTILTATAFPGP
jgi:transmembrane 9 superfamily member 2/4